MACTLHYYLFFFFCLSRIPLLFVFGVLRAPDVVQVAPRFEWGEAVVEYSSQCDINISPTNNNLRCGSSESRLADVRYSSRNSISTLVV